VVITSLASTPPLGSGPRASDARTVASLCCVRQLTHDIPGRNYAHIEFIDRGARSAARAVIGFNRTTESGLDSVDKDNADWLPHESQLRELLADTYCGLDPTDDGWRVRIEPNGAPHAQQAHARAGPRPSRREGLAMPMLLDSLPPGRTSSTRGQGPRPQVRAPRAHSRRSVRVAAWRLSVRVRAY
jgi:hypothetical protein